jgi:N-acyl-D-aspartate/D-glutamate deacylase
LDPIYKGFIVTPGFIDLHTHLDPYAFWQPSMSPAVYHGITTCLMGNCSVSLAPCKPEHREVLAELMEVVEEVPKSALLSKLPWSWESYGEYLQAVEACQPAINVAGLASLASIRLSVVGNRLFDATATFSEDEVDQIAKLAAQTVKEGAFGISSIRNRSHRDQKGRPPPGNYANHDEVVAICSAISRHDGIFQTIPNMGADYKNDGGTATEVYMRELELFRKATAAGARVLFAPGNFGEPGREGSHDLSIARATDDAIQEMKADGALIHAVQMPRTLGILSGLQIPRFPVGSKRRGETPTWHQLLAEKDEGRRLAMINDASTCAALILEASSGAGAKLWAKWAQGNYWLQYPGNTGSNASGGAHEPSRPHYPAVKSQTEGRLDCVAKDRGQHPAETWIELHRCSEGKTMFYAPFANKLNDVMELHLRSDWCLPGLGDSGAHLSSIIDAGWTSYMLSYWHRERGFFSIAEVVRRMTSAPAHAAGIHERGVLRKGMRADLNVIDLARVTEGHPYMVQDLPWAGGRRLMQRSHGYVATIVNGEVVVSDGELTGNRSGHVLRRGERESHAPPPSLPVPPARL